MQCLLKVRHVVCSIFIIGIRQRCPPSPPEDVHVFDTTEMQIIQTLQWSCTIGVGPPIRINSAPFLMRIQRYLPLIHFPCSSSSSPPITQQLLLTSTFSHLRRLPMPLRFLRTSRGEKNMQHAYRRHELPQMLQNTYLDGSTHTLTNVLI